MPTEMIKLMMSLLLKWVILVGLLSLFTILSTVIPAQSIRKNIERSLLSVEKEGDFPEPMIKQRKHGLDYSMDGMIMNQIYTIDNKNPISSAILVKSLHSDQPGVSKWYELDFNIKNNTREPNLNYPRYWHGSTFLFRLLFTFLDFNGLKELIYFASSLLLILFLVTLAKYIGVLSAMMYAIGLIFVNIYVMQFSLQFAPVLLISLGIGLLLGSSKKQMTHAKALTIFMITGSLTSYFDLLTAPLLTLGLPLLVWASFLVIDEDTKFKTLISKLLNLIAIWTAAFALTWFVKWVLAAIFTDFPIFQNVLHEATQLSKGMNNERIQSVVMNVNQLPLVLFNSVLSILIIFSVFFFNKKGLKKALLIGVIAVLPFFWLLIMAHHSVIHYWFTYRILAISMIGLLLMVKHIIDWDSLFKRIPKITTTW